MREFSYYFDFSSINLKSRLRNFVSENYAFLYHEMALLPLDTSMVEKSKLDEDKEGKAVDPSHYHGSAYRNRKALKCDADHAGCQDTRHSTSDGMQRLGDRLVSWSSKRQKSAAISSTEAEYI
ncbi:hypothetical protein Tco_0275563, partial [Tanacetum coccineum]